jgi:prepilin-type N-terminal cleavage/methylation domain-containing protein/prepilin-type processing-associated H-X9-DG protein
VRGRKEEHIVHRRRGFTLIELLVVIAIIAILAAILFPVFIKAKEKARTMKCLAHGREVGQAMLMYTADYLDRFPTNVKDPKVQAQLATITWRYVWAPGTSWERSIWSAGDFCYMRMYQLKKYCKNEDIWICPDPNSMYAKRYAYGFRNSWFFNGSGLAVTGDMPMAGRTLGEIQAGDAAGGYRDPDTDQWVSLNAGKNYLPPAKKIAFLCYTLGRWAQNGKVGDGSYPWIFPSYAHDNGSTYVYADGHAEWKRTGMGCAPVGYTHLEVDQHP